MGFFESACLVFCLMSEKYMFSPIVSHHRSSFKVRIKAILAFALFEHKQRLDKEVIFHNMEKEKRVCFVYVKSFNPILLPILILYF